MIFRNLLLAFPFSHAMTYVVIYPDRLTSCSLMKSTLPIALASSVLFNSDSITTAGLDVLSVLTDKDAAIKINDGIAPPPNAADTLLDEQCTDHTSLIEETSSLISNLFAKQINNQRLRAMIAQLIDKNILLIDGSKTKLTYEEMLRQYYYQGAASEIGFLLPECAAPSLDIDKTKMGLNLFQLIQKNLEPIAYSIKAAFTNCNGCAKEFVTEIVKVSGMSFEDNYEETLFGIMHQSNELFDTIIAEVLKLPEEEFSKNIGEIISGLLTGLPQPSEGSGDIIKTVSQNVIAVVDELYSEVTGYAPQPHATLAFKKLMAALQC